VDEVVVGVGGEEVAGVVGVHVGEVVLVVVVKG
jgi:hypothetical protein